MLSDQDKDIVFAPALTQAQLIRDRQISPLELVELYLTRIETYNPQLGCFFHVAAESAIADAQQKTEQIAKTKETKTLPPLFGVPTAIKDLNAVAGMPINYGVSTIKEQIADYDDGLVSKIKAAGLIILGKTATSQLGSLPYTESPGFIPTRNPWNLDYTAGGSSGGAASAVAAGLCALAQGNDGGGSIRGPAFCCGLVGIKPSRGRISYAPVGDFQNGIATNGVLARNVRDGAALLDIMSGYITGDPYWLTQPEIPFLSAIEQTLPQLSVGFATAVLPEGEAHPICQESITQTVNIIEAMGHRITEISFDVTSLIEPFKIIWSAGVASSGVPLEALSRINRWIAGLSGSAGDYLRAVQQMQIFSRQIVSLFDNYDVLVLPTYMHPTIKVGEFADFTPEETLTKIISWILPCPCWNATGQPAIAIPTGFDDNGLPVGVQLIGKPASESLILTLASKLEAAINFTSVPTSLLRLV
ncbi:MAG: amidase [Xenococcaceae cyanobacterium MO_167.B27]|nr:amidase [Xenococcaceae cyanobacterium MO_167.B27]